MPAQKDSPSICLLAGAFAQTDLKLDIQKMPKLERDFARVQVASVLERGPDVVVVEKEIMLEA